MPVLTPVTVPDPVPTPATELLLLAQLPPATASVKLVVTPWHNTKLPDMATGIVFTVTSKVAEHEPTVYEIVVLPAASPDTRPVPAPTVAVIVLLLLQFPPAVASVRFVADPAHIDDIPVIETGVKFTVKVVVTLHPPASE